MKQCTQCKKDKEESEFFPDYRTTSGKLQAECKRCHGGVEELICSRCGTKWWPNGGGEGRRKDSLCHFCYPLYRQAYCLWYAAKNRAKKNNLAFDISISFIEDEILKGCPKTGFKFDIKTKGKSYKERSPYSPSIDKIDPKKGYTADNIQVVCWWYNLCKAQFTDTDVLDFCKAVIQVHDRG